MTPKLAAIFTSHWNVYQKIITYNYMRHKDMAAHSSEIFAGVKTRTPLKVLDLGCGDAQPIIPRLQQQPVASYTGYDLSEVALQFAQENLSKVNCITQLRQAPMQQFDEIEEGTFDVIHSSYAIHHLQQDEMRAILQSCFTRLDDGGVMIVVDIFRNDGQPREDYIEEYIDNIKATWQMITPGEQEEVFYHMRQYDFPVPANDMAGWAEDIGFTVTTHRVDRLHTMLVLKK